MHDIRAIRDDSAAFDAAMARRGVDNASAPILELDEARRAKIHAAETAQAEQNKASKEVGAAKAKGDEAEFERLRALVGEKKAEVAAAVPFGRMGRAEDLTGMAIFLASPDADYVVAQTYNVDGGNWMS